LGASDLPYKGICLAKIFRQQNLDRLIIIKTVFRSHLFHCLFNPLCQGFFDSHGIGGISSGIGLDIVAGSVRQIRRCDVFRFLGVFHGIKNFCGFLERIIQFGARSRYRKKGYT
jgi:hypothetical protein